MKNMMLAILSATLLIASAFAATVGPETVLPASPLPAHEPCVAYGDGKYLAVWQSGKAEKADLYACRLDEKGKPLDAKPFVISQAVECQERPRIAWGKDSWLVVWGDLRNDTDYDVYAARVAPDGKVLDPDGIPIAVGKHNQAQPDVAFNGENWLVVWRSFDNGNYVGRGARITPDGKLLDQQALKVTDEKDSGLSVGELRVGAAGGKWLAAWITKANYFVGARGGGGELYVSSVTADGKATTALLGKSNDQDRFISPVTLAGNGKDASLLSWFNGGTGGRSGPARGQPYGAMRVDSGGKMLGTTELGGKKVEIKQPAAAWDGKGYLVVFWDGRRASVEFNVPKHVNRIVAHLVAEDGKYEGQVEVSAGEPNPGFSPAACGDGKGQCLVVYERHPAKADDTIVIAARLIRR